MALDYNKVVDLVKEDDVGARMEEREPELIQVQGL